ncbi:flagellum-specific ATP synthase FliI [Acuticoccus sediminis]|uniref:Flagellum-specific ATP synthase FliI n=1 Tax=Acuticoccus sediminis TaxID=2184697 RepID=A0A8B2NS75_9HYPH|nr:FliI/YscN family ATPase [Acuticoccus sediminis]RAI00223.1 flagellum-specific ATP synthase FliI [Acuticoccus sediminis]
MGALERLADVLDGYTEPAVRLSGVVCEANPTDRFVRGLSRHAALGDQLLIHHHDGAALAEVVRIDRERVTASPYERRHAAFIGAGAALVGRFELRPCDEWLGRVVDALGRPLDHGEPLPLGPVRRVDADPPKAMKRAPLNRALRTGVKVLDIFAPLVEGQRVGIFAGSGVGKSTLLGMIGAAATFDVVVAALVGERGREVMETLDGPLAEHRDRTVAVVSTGDETPMMRRLAPMTAMAVAEYFREQGKRVLLVVDSLTRYAHAARDVALAAGEPPVSRGYPPSVFADMARLVERAGRTGLLGSITGVFAVLVDGDDMDEPVADTARGTLDGHIVLSRAIAEQGRLPAVDPLASLSRLADKAFRHDEWELSRRLRALISRFEDTRDLRLLGGYKPGSDAELDKAVQVVPHVYEALVQMPADKPSEDAFAELAALLTGRTAGGEADPPSA